jgi:prevent-host-death family protein
MQVQVFEKKDGDFDFAPIWPLVATLLLCRSMATVPQKELRNNIGEVLRRAEAGEQITVTVSGRPVAQLGPAQPRQWVAAAQLADLWRTSADPTLEGDLEAMDGGIVDPWTPAP